TPTPPPPTPTPPPPVTKQGDINGDDAVNIFDLSILLSNYGKARSASSNPNADINNNNTVDIFDLSILLSKYGT
ncbi:MAG TPA: dockerin type I domain-containing protein, partial [Candidatus Polarisedimenticolaceae bacterium]|nr:dockerin type I domain-containing protein [Candidatus Polarisedimenticolaceae bacterium]